MILILTKMANKRKICPTKLEISDKSNNKTQDMSESARYVRHKLVKQILITYFHSLICSHVAIMKWFTANDIDDNVPK